ncbi:MAG: hypothetical protein HYR60_13225 [Acidobacteria bacterium]|nr:hypothetical protein [Acidobacteriota bacterium]
MRIGGSSPGRIPPSFLCEPASQAAHAGAVRRAEGRQSVASRVVSSARSSTGVTRALSSPAGRSVFHRIGVALRAERPIAHELTHVLQGHGLAVRMLADQSRRLAGH